MGTALTVEQTRLLSRYTKELVLCYDNDTAGQTATEKAITLLENSEFTVRVLRLPRRLENGEYVKQDVDDFIKLQGPPAFEAILNGSENQMDYRLEAAAAKYDLTDGEQKIAFAAEASALIAAMPSAVEREVYAGRAAEMAGISREAMGMEVKRARGRRKRQDRRALQKESLNVAALHQPKDRSLRYTDHRSAMAEEGVVRLLFLDGTLARRCGELEPEAFSSPLLGSVYRYQREMDGQGRSPALAGLEGRLAPEEMSHLTTILQKPEVLSNAGRSLPDYIQIIKTSAAKRQGDGGADPLAAAVDRLKERKGTGGKRHV